MAEARLGAAHHPSQVGLRADAADAGLLGRLGDALGTTLPTSAGEVRSAGARRVLWLGPDEWLVVDDDGSAPELVAALEAAAGDGFATAVDLSSNRVMLELAGPGAAEALSAGVAIDLHPRAFPAGSCAQTLMARTQVLLERDGEGFRVYVRPSFAPYAIAWLEDALATRG